MDSLQGSLTAMTQLFTSKMDEFQQQLQHKSASPPTTSTLASDFANFRLFIMSALDTIQKQMEFLVRHMDRLDMRGRRKMLLFHGLPEQKGEDINDTVTRIVLEKLKLPDFSSNSIKRAHRLGRPSDSKPRPVAVKFREVSVRNQVWFAKTKLKGTGITQSEFLTKSRHSTFMRARQLFGATKCWTRDGTIHILAPGGSQHQAESLVEVEAIPLVPVSSGQPATASSRPTVSGSKAMDVRSTSLARQKRPTRKL